MEKFSEVAAGRFEVGVQGYSGAGRRRLGVGGGLRRNAETKKRAKAQGKGHGNRQDQTARQSLARQVKRAVATLKRLGHWRRLRTKTGVHGGSYQSKLRKSVDLGMQIIEAALDDENDARAQAAQRERSYEDAIVHMNNSVAGNMMWTHLTEETREAIRARLGREGKILRLHVV